MRDEPVYNPLHKKRLAESVSNALLERTLSPLPPTDAFMGAGIYALYYLGNFPLYRVLAEANQGDSPSWPIYVGKAESLLIQRFAPIWNQALDGFGNHDPGKGRYRQQRSPWDAIHPGRRWALKCAPNKRSEDEIKAAVRTFLRGKYGAQPDPS